MSRRLIVAAGTLGVLIAGSYSVVIGTLSRPAASAAGDSVVVAELFTSEGCSSCPPADALLIDLLSQQPVAGVTVLGLSEHVDYWNRLGWRDPFSSAAFTGRQSEYHARVFPTGSIYTPQLVVDGHLEEIGSDAVAVKRAIARAAQAPKATVEVDATGPDEAGSLRIQIGVIVPPAISMQEGTDLVLAVTEDHLMTSVQSGENRGRRLKHGAVVRTMTQVGAVPPQTRDWSAMTSVAVRPEWKFEELKVIAFLQERSTRRIIGAGRSDVRSNTR